LADYGSLAVVTAELEEEKRRLEAGYMPRPSAKIKLMNGHADEYWSHAKALDADQYLKNVVYGGDSGFAYVRSLAEFVKGDDNHKVYSITRFECPSTFLLDDHPRQTSRAMG
jgi:hypothetical protein